MIDVTEVKDPQQSNLDPRLKSMLEFAEPKDKNFIYCAICSNVVTKPEERVEINGSHGHHFTNPHGFEFHVGCFGQALGCTISGQPEAADSWFMGHVWRLASCAECHNHLGWYFSHPTGDNYFYGLILANIQDEQ
ncbi:MAG: hypothetical protein ACI9ON_001495 [Limisphaerales bacterium]|jgi:hypothetical protein